jgi:hypothetical protein
MRINIEKSTLTYFDFSGIQPEFNLLPCLCCQGVRFLHSLRTVLFLRRELKTKHTIDFSFWFAQTIYDIDVG